MKRNVKANCQSSMLLAVIFLLSKCSSFYIQNTIPMIHRGVYVSPSPTFNNFNRFRVANLKESSTRIADADVIRDSHNDPKPVESTSTIYDPDTLQRPKTLPLLQSFALFCRYALTYWREKKEERKRAKELRQTGKSIRSIRKVLEDKASKWKMLKQFYTSGKNLFNLVGYDAALLIPAGCFLVFGAVFESIRPHYWSKCISYVVSAEPRRSKVVNALVGLSISNFFGALFTGLRGAMFWIAGT
jgi:hypothetical protein